MEIVKLLIEKGADVKRKPKYGDTPLNLAAFHASAAAAAQAASEDAGNGKFNSDRSSYDPLESSNIF